MEETTSVKNYKKYQTTLTELLPAAEGIVFGRRGMYPVVQNGHWLLLEMVAKCCWIQLISDGKYSS